MIKVEHLCKRYRDIVAVDDLSFTVEKGEILGFLGPNGAGKTTTMRAITGATPATSGSVVVDGYDVFDSPLEVKRRIGYLPEQPPLYPDLTVAEQLRFAADLKGISRRDRKDAIEQAAQKAGVADVLRRRIGNLSKGFRQRTGLAQALVGAPPVLVLDEPTAGLDPAQITEVRDLIESLAGDHTVILSTHILAEVTRICRRVLIISRGRRVALDDIDALGEAHREGDRIPSLEEIFLRLTSN